MCDCNGHGNVSLGSCDSETGACFCTNDTEGPHCEFCKHNYFGDARYAILFKLQVEQKEASQ